MSSSCQASKIKLLSPINYNQWLAAPLPRPHSSTLTALHTSLILLGPLVGRPYYIIPKGRTDSEPGLLSSEMVLVVVLLQSVEPGTLAVAGVDVVKRVVSKVVTQVAYPECYPEKGKYYGIADGDYFDCQRKQQVQLNYHQHRRMHQSLPEIKHNLRVVGKHVVNAMQGKMRISDNLRVRQPVLGMKDKSVQDVLDEGPKDEAAERGQEGETEVKVVPGLDAVDEVTEEDCGKWQDVPPLEDAEELHEVGLKHAGGGDEEPVRRVDEFEVVIPVEVPDLGHEGLVGVDEPADLLFEGADDHGVSHAEGQRVVKLHFFVYFLKVFVFEEGSSSGVVALEGRHIEDVVVENEESFAAVLGVGVDFLQTFEFHVVLRHVQLFYFNIQQSLTRLIPTASEKLSYILG